MNQKDLALLLQTHEFNAQDPAPVEQVVFRIQFKKIGSLGDFILFSGRPKAGKGKYIAGCIAAALSRTEIFDMSIRLPEEKRKVVHFDTEQSKYSHWKMMELIKQLTAENLPAFFKSYRCRSVGPSQILAMIEYFLKLNPDTGIVYLDGLLDTIESINDEKHSNYIKRWLKRITEDYNVLLAGVIHRGFSSDKSIGHIGSDGERAAQSVLHIEKDKERKQYIMKSEYLRDDDDILPVAIHYNTQLQLWEQTEYLPEAPANLAKANKRRPRDFELSEHADHVYRIFKTEPVQSYDNLTQSIKEVYGVGRSWAVDCVKVLTEMDLIYRTPDGYTNRKQGAILSMQ